MFWENFSSCCHELSKTPNAVCKELGLSTATATHWKNGVIPKGDVLLKIADYLNCSTDYLLGRTNIKSNTNNLTVNEQLLLNNYRELSDQGKEYILQTMDIAMNTFTATDIRLVAEDNISQPPIIKKKPSTTNPDK